MAKSKYQKDAKGNNILGVQHGITVTRPWSNEMYEHNDKVAEMMKAEISKVIEEVYNDGDGDYDKMVLVGRAINAYGYGNMMTLDDIYEDCKDGLDKIQNHWMHSDTWPALLKAGLVQPLSTGFVGYDKL